MRDFACYTHRQFYETIETFSAPFWLPVKKDALPSLLHGHDTLLSGTWVMTPPSTPTKNLWKHPCKFVKFLKNVKIKNMIHALYPVFQKKSIENGQIWPPRHAHEVSLVYFKNCGINRQRKFLLQIRWSAFSSIQEENVFIIVII